MIRFWVTLLVCCLGSLVSACQTSSAPDVGVKLSEIINQPNVISFPLKKSQHGRWIVPLRINDDHEVDMVIDTGATFSALFESSVQSAGLSPGSEKVRIHGLVANAEALTTRAEKVEFGQDFLGSKLFAILPSEDKESENFEIHDGVIGMDILERYKLYISSKNKQIYFIPRSSEFIQQPLRFVEIDLYANPYSELAPNLHFFNLSVKNNYVPALLDTGTDVHIINWHAATFVEAKSLRSQLKWEWEVSGAVGEFKPVVAAKIRSLSSGRYEWEDTVMIIRDTDSLDFIGVSDKPFIVAGVNLLGDRDVFLDFDADKMWLQPTSNTDVNHTISICPNCLDRY